MTRFEFTRPSVPFESSFWTRERGPTESAFLRKECNRSPSLCLSIFALPILERYECCCVYIDWRGLRKRPRARVTKEPSHRERNAPGLKDKKKEYVYKFGRHEARRCDCADDDTLMSRLGFDDNRLVFSSEDEELEIMASVFGERIDSLD